MLIGDRFNIHIDSYSHDGYGVGRVNGMVVMVPGAMAGETCEVTAARIADNYVIADLQKLCTSSPTRVQPFCGHFSRCGGCDLQHMSYEHQLSFKKEVVKNALLRIGGFSDVDSVLQDTLGMDKPFGYRNNVQFQADEEGHFGFFRKNSNDVEDIDECPLQSNLANRVFKCIKRYCRDNAFFKLERIVIRSDRQDEKFMLVLGAKKAANGVQELVDMVKTEFPECVSIYFKSEQEYNLIYGTSKMIDSIESDFLKNRLEFYVSPQSFFQVNPLQTTVLYDKVLEFAGTNLKNVFDLYCGTGTISLFLAGLAERVTGIEAVSRAVEDAKDNALRNNCKNAEFIKGQAEKVMPRLLAGQPRLVGGACELVVVDPPRSGCDKRLLVSVLDAKPDKIVYVSCNPATLARDLKVLAAGGYLVEKVQPVDMFGWTRHVECVVLMSKLKSITSIEVKIDLDEMDLTKSESKATYDEIKAYVLEQTGLKVTQLYIAQGKRKHGIIERENYNTGEGKTKVPRVPEELHIHNSTKYCRG